MARLNLPPLLSSRPTPVQGVLVAAVPALFGALCGWLLGVSEVAYLVLAGPVAILGGFGAGLEHQDSQSGAKRGVVGGAIFGTFILLGHEISGEGAEASLPDPAILLAVFTALGGALLGALGGRLRRLRGSAPGLV
jgi:hypothetical protein